MEGELSVSCLEGVNVHGAIATLRGNKLVQWIPTNTLDVMAVLDNLTDAIPIFVKDSGNVVHGTSDEILSVRRPREVVDFTIADGAAGPLNTPALLLFLVLSTIRATCSSTMLFLFVWNP